MNKLMVAAMAVAAFTAFADEPNAGEAKGETEKAQESEAESEDGAPLFWGFGSTGIGTK